jgi:hypothetical protein
MFNNIDDFNDENVNYTYSLESKQLNYEKILDAVHVSTPIKS